jgi:hypothetical protein
MLHLVWTRERCFHWLFLCWLSRAALCRATSLQSPLRRLKHVSAYSLYIIIRFPAPHLSSLQNPQHLSPTHHLDSIADSLISLSHRIGLALLTFALLTLAAWGSWIRFQDCVLTGCLRMRRSFCGKTLGFLCSPQTPAYYLLNFDCWWEAQCWLQLTLIHLVAQLALFKIVRMIRWRSWKSHLLASWALDQAFLLERWACLWPPNCLRLIVLGGEFRSLLHRYYMICLPILWPPLYAYCLSSTG